MSNMCGCCSQGRPTQMWSVNRAVMGHFLIQTHTQTAVGLIQCEWRKVTSVNSCFGSSDLWPLLSLWLSSCHGRIVRKGDATSDNACEPEAFISSTQLQTSKEEPQPEIVSTVAATTMTTVSVTSDLKTPREPTDSITYISPEVLLNHSTESPSPSANTEVNLGTVTNLVLQSSHYEKTVRSYQCLNISHVLPLCCLVISFLLAAVIASIVGAPLLICIIVLLCTTVRKKGNSMQEKRSLNNDLALWECYRCL